MTAHAGIVRTLIGRAARRGRIIAALYGATCGVAIAIVLAAGARFRAGVPPWTVSFAIALVGAAVATLLRREPRTRTALRLERTAPTARNVIVTAVELLDGSVRAGETAVARVLQDAARVAGTLDVRRAYPMRRPITTFAASVLLWSAVTAARAAGPVVGGSRDSGGLGDIVVTVIPPRYAGDPARTVKNPERIEALEGSTIRLDFARSADTVAIETLSGVVPVTSTGAGVRAEFVADTNGFVVVSSRAADAPHGQRRLIPVTVRADERPRVRITAPGKDLFYPDTRHTVNLGVQASDDIGPASLSIRYTKVSGSGEQFTFTEGTVPVQVARADARKWTATGALALEGMHLEAGDVIVYRAVATDAHPGVPPAESDAFIVEITTPGAVAAEGFAADDQRDRYGISQQMVILKTERLIAQQRSMNADSVAASAQLIAAEQRAVRAEFVFMMGGEVAEDVLNAVSLTELNEESEARGEEDIAAGRLANKGRLEIVRAIRSMSQASAALGTADLSRALTQERAALESLQSAFARARYILRALTQRERLDDTRRLTGVLVGAARSARPVPSATESPRTAALVRALRDVSQVSGEREFSAAAAGRLADISRELLASAPGAAELERVVTQLGAAASAIGAGRSSAARTAVDSASQLLVRSLRARRPAAPLTVRSAGMNRLDGALTDALRGKNP